jgi:hypothetical protein
MTDMQSSTIRTEAMSAMTSPNVSKQIKNMTVDMRHKMIKVWRAIQKDQRDLDFRKSAFSKDLRAHFAAGKTGDNLFHKWCLDNLGLQRNQTQELLARGVAATIVADADTWNLLNGYKSIAYVRDLPRKEQIAVIEAAKKSGYSIRTIMTKRGHSLPGYAPEPVVPSNKPIEKSTAKPQRRGVYADIKELANFIARSSLKLPPDVRVIVDMYKGL